MSGKKKKGYAFIKFSSHDEAAAAVDAMNGKEMEGRELKCNFSSGKIPEKKPRTENAEGGESQ